MATACRRLVGWIWLAMNCQEAAISTSCAAAASCSSFCSLIDAAYNKLPKVDFKHKKKHALETSAWKLKGIARSGNTNDVILERWPGCFFWFVLTNLARAASVASTFASTTAIESTAAVTLPPSTAPASLFSLAAAADATLWGRCARCSAKCG